MKFPPASANRRHDLAGVLAGCAPGPALVPEDHRAEAELRDPQAAARRAACSARKPPSVDHTLCTDILFEHSIRRCTSLSARDAAKAAPHPRRGARTAPTILDATERLLAERRFDELSVADILEAAKVSRSSFYFYFESKHAVLAELVRAAVDQAVGVAQPWLDHEPEESTRAALEHGTRGGARLWREHAPVLRAVVENWRSDPGLAQLWTEMMERFTALAAERIELDRRSGRAPTSGSDPRTLAALLTWMGERAYYLAAIGHPEFNEEERLVDALTDIWLAVIYNGPPAPRENE